MQEERERGRINGLAKKRATLAKFAATLKPAFAQARVQYYSLRKDRDITLTAYAEYLNAEGWRSRKGKAFTAETISRLFQIHIGQIDKAEREFDKELEIYRFKVKLNLEPQQAQRDLADAQIKRIEAIEEAFKLEADLKGEVYRRREIKPRLTTDDGQDRYSFERVSAGP